MSKNKAATPHGEVEYETVTCDHCGTEIMADDAIAVRVGVSESKGTFNSINYSGGRGRNLCEYCAGSVLNYNRSGGGAIRTGIERLWWRLTELDDMPFMLIFATMGAFIGWILAVFIGEILVALLGALL